MKKLIMLMAVIVGIVLLGACNKEKKSSDKEESTEPPVSAEPANEPDSVRVYIDNSGSMRGYTEGQNSVFINAISDLKSVKNGEAYFWGAKPKTPITGIIGESLARNSFNGQDTPFPSMIAQLEHEAAKSGALTFIVTDGIIGVSSKQALYLKASLGQIKNDIRDSAKVEQGMAISVFRLVSGYSNKSGKSFYYTHKNTPVKLDSANQRPFFVIAIGKRANIQWFMDKVRSDESLSAYKNAANITFGLHKHSTDLSFSDFNAFKSEKGTNKLTKKKGKFNLMADLPECLVKDLGENYVNEHIEVMLNDGSCSYIKHSINGNSLIVNCSDVSQIFSIDNIITVKLKKTIPNQWLTQWSSEDDSNIVKDPMEQTRTFALSYLLNGLYEATDGGQMLLDTKFEFKK